MLLKQSTARNRMILMVDSADHITGKTGLTLTVTLSKDGGAFAAMGGTVTEISSGWYKLALNTTDTGTLGDLAIHATSTGADPTDVADQVVALLPGDNVTVGTNNDKTGYTVSTVSDKTGYSLTAAYDPAKTASQAGDIMKVSSGTGANQISLSSGQVTVGTNNDKTGYTASTVTDKTGYSLTQAFPTNFSSLGISAAGNVNSDIKKVNAVTVNGTGAGGTPWGP